MNNSIVYANTLPVVIDKSGIYIMRNGSRARIDTVEVNSNKSVTAFTCKGSVERMFRGKLRFKGYAIWHESGQATGFESEYDIISKGALC